MQPRRSVSKTAIIEAISIIICDVKSRRFRGIFYSTFIVSKSARFRDDPTCCVKSDRRFRFLAGVQTFRKEIGLGFQEITRFIDRKTYFDISKNEE
jgi:hypothetical protein